MGLFSKECGLCKKKIDGKPLEAKVEVFGRVGLWKRHFCSEEHYDEYLKRTAALMSTRRPNVCKKCLK